MMHSSSFWLILFLNRPFFSWAEIYSTIHVAENLQSRHLPKSTQLFFCNSRATSISHVILCLLKYIELHYTMFMKKFPHSLLTLCWFLNDSGTNSGIIAKCFPTLILTKGTTSLERYVAESFAFDQLGNCSLCLSPASLRPCMALAVLLRSL
jgi:hypothetical protein